MAFKTQAKRDNKFTKFVQNLVYQTECVKLRNGWAEVNKDTLFTKYAIAIVILRAHKPLYCIPTSDVQLPVVEYLI